ncbi:HN1_G0016100.mRNA.1.CDS.1 [Saccharomyces cerevisiae]|nr:HN1_G0016100.mRNA.1.CDS.1 [Saccharomyces cerevisiae]CAI4274998.1 BAL_1a_G0003860.mRNA.1.CDS.1 [Saccharomyces cerevisiae]CAI7048403.1 BAL_1a_G0003860.mRNA.1.CDS.1 [Saccharomyces cerevisiae]
MLLCFHMCQGRMWLPFDLMKWRRFHCSAVLVGTLSLRNRSPKILSLYFISDRTG